MIRKLAPLALLVACASDDFARTPTLTFLPDFEDDCTEVRNDDISAPSGLESIDEQQYVDVQLCRDEADVYRVDIPAGKWLSVEIIIDGTGSGTTDLDLWELDGEGVEIWQSTASERYERLAWYNPGDYPVARYLMVNGYRGGAANYTIEIKVSDYHQGLDCDAFYPDVSRRDERGPCNEIMQFPNNLDPAAGYYVEHDAHYSNLRREVQYLVAYASRETMAAFPDTRPLALMDMSQRDGDVPGRMEGRLRHPEGTHTNGNDIDIAYYQNGGDNGGRAVCGNNGYFCTAAPTRLDARRTAFFLAKLFESSNTRVIGVDPLIAAQVQPAAWDLADEGILTSREARDVDSGKLAYGDGWPFHHHHLHFSWKWEGGVEYRAAPTDPPDGCMAGADISDAYVMER